MSSQTSKVTAIQPKKSVQTSVHQNPAATQTIAPGLVVDMIPAPNGKFEQHPGYQRGDA